MHTKDDVKVALQRGNDQLVEQFLALRWLGFVLLTTNILLPGCKKNTIKETL